MSKNFKARTDNNPTGDCSGGCRWK